jgi:hypothetical protein
MAFLKIIYIMELNLKKLRIQNLDFCPKNISWKSINFIILRPCLNY